MNHSGMRVLFLWVAFTCMFIWGVACKAVPEGHAKKMQVSQSKYGSLVLEDLDLQDESVLGAIEKVNHVIQKKGIEGFTFYYDLELDLKFSKDSRERFIQLQEEVRNLSIGSATVEEVALRIADAHGLTFGYGVDMIYFYPKNLFEVKHNLSREIATRLSSDTYIGSVNLRDLIDTINMHLIAQKLEVKWDTSLTTHDSKQERVFLPASGSMRLGEILDLISIELNADYYYSDEMIFFSASSRYDPMT